MVLFPGIYRLLLNLYIREMMHLGIHNTDTCNIHASDQIISVLFIFIFFLHSLPDQYFSAVVCFLLFNMGDWCGRATAGAIKWVRRKSNYLSSQKTILLISFMLSCILLKISITGTHIYLWINRKNISLIQLCVADHIWNIK